MRLRHCVWIAIPIVAFFIAPFLPFVNTTGLWLGLPAPVVWSLIWTVGVTVSLWAVERSVHGAGAGAGARTGEAADE